MWEPAFSYIIIIVFYFLFALCQALATKRKHVEVLNLGNMFAVAMAVTFL